MTVISLREHQERDVGPLAPAAGIALARSGILKFARPSLQPGYWTLKASDTVGVARVGGVELRIASKIPIKRIFFLLSYADGWTGWREDAVSVPEETELPAAVAAVFARHAELALRRGPIHGYQRKEDALTVVRGRIRVGAQIQRRYALPIPIEVAYNDFSIDTAENRLLLGAAQKLLRLPGISVATRAALHRIPARLPGVTGIPRGRSLPTWNRTRLNARYHTALALAELVLRAGSIDLGEGQVPVDGFLLDLNSVFEDFVVGALSQALDVFNGRCMAQDRAHHLDERRRLSLRPDLVWYGPSGKPAAVADAKYKTGDRGRYPVDDIYQMLAYCIRLGLTDGHLIYAAGNAPATTHRIENTGITIIQHALDLDTSPLLLLQQIAAIAAAMRSPTQAPADSPTVADCLDLLPPE